jgi:hypothetical protein
VLADTAEPGALEDADVDARSLLGFGVEPQTGGEHVAGDAVSPSRVSYCTTGDGISGHFTDACVPHLVGARARLATITRYLGETFARLGDGELASSRIA